MRINELRPRYVSEVFGSRIYSKWLEKRLVDVLTLSFPQRSNFYFYAKTLRECGFNDIDILLVTENAMAEGMCKWKIYDREKFKKELHNVYKNGEHNVNGGATFNSIPNPSLVLSGGYFIHLFKSLIPVSKLDISDSCFYAAIQYRMLGMAALPRNFKKCKKLKCIEEGYCKHPDIAIKWKQYQDRLPTEKEMLSWNYKAGICLIANDNFCFLDVDPEGKGLVDDNMFKNHYENTPRTGYHFFAKAIPGLESGKKDGIELKAKGELIVTYPTQGYMLGQEVKK